jgi:hypothetical protein
MITYIITLLLAIPFALFLEKLCKEEIRDWLTRFKIISIISIILAITTHFSNLEYKIPIIIGLLFITITLDTLIIRDRLNKKK